MASSLRAALPSEGRNALLESLSRAAGTALAGHLSQVGLETEQLLFAEDEGVDGLYFPLSCVICRLVSLPEGTTVKVSLAGREGVVGSSALTSNVGSTFRGLVQLPGLAAFIPRSAARNLLNLPAATQILFRYMLVVMRETSLTAACNRAHTASQRLARWLLMIQDRAEQDEFSLTHESLSTMLGVRRERISLSAKELRSKKAIEYRRGNVAITDRRQLEKLACSCYWEITDDYLRFLDGELEAD
jgi:CRP-like cAMP-binding protein